MKILVDILYAIVVFIVLYFGFGFCFSRLFSNQYRNNPFFWLILNFIIGPVLINLLFLFIKVNFIALIIFLIICYLITNLLFLKKIQINLDIELNIFKNKNIYIFLIFFIFFILVTFTKIPLIFLKDLQINGWFDGYFHILRFISLPTTGIPPKHYNSPNLDLIYYYLGYIIPGLLSRFSNNFIPVNISWFMHLLINYAITLFLIYLMIINNIKNFIGKLISTLSLLFFSNINLGLFSDLLNKSQNILSHLFWFNDFVKQRFIAYQTYFFDFVMLPNHIMAISAGIGIFIILFNSRGNRLLKNILISLLMALSFGSGITTSLTIIVAFSVWSVFISFMKKSTENINDLMFILPMFALLSYKFILYSLRGKELILIEPIFHNFIRNNNIISTIINFILTFFILNICFLGIQFILLIVSFFLYRQEFFRDFKKTFLLISLYPFIAVFFIGTKEWNDLALRQLIFAQFALSLIIGGVFDNYNIIKFKKRIISLSILSLIFIFVISGGYTYAENYIYMKSTINNLKKFDTYGLYGIWKINEVNRELADFIRKKTPYNSIIISKKYPSIWFTYFSQRLNFVQPDDLDGNDLFLLDEEKIDKNIKLNFDCYRSTLPVDNKNLKEQINKIKSISKYPKYVILDYKIGNIEPIFSSDKYNNYLYSLEMLPSITENLPLNDTIDFINNKGMSIDIFLQEGWSNPEPGGRWALKDFSTFYFKITDPSRYTKLTLSCMSWNEQKVTVFINDKRAGEFIVPSQEWKNISISLHKGVLLKGANLIKMKYSDYIIPDYFLHNGDLRELSCRFEFIKLE